jgi:CDP-diacylglycerol---serine O-phosphatidyltransferase
MDVPAPNLGREARSRRRMSKGMYILPSLFTTGNMAAGFYAILEVLHASAVNFLHLDNAAKAIGFAVLFDGLDGRVARMTGTSSDFGKELDSLADVIILDHRHQTRSSVTLSHGMTCNNCVSQYLT